MDIPGSRKPGRSEAPPGLEKLLLLGFLGLLRLFRLLRFLSHSILSGLMDGTRHERHARRRASLAKTSKRNRTDSEAAAPHCHLSVTALSTALMRFRVPLAKFSCADARCIRRKADECAFVRQREAALNAVLEQAPMWAKSGRRLRDLHQFKTTADNPETV